MKILVTGSSGFVGTNLLKQLTNHEIVDAEKLIEGFNITNQDHMKKLAEEEYDVIIHLAAVTSIDKSFKSPEYFYDINLLGLLNILKLARLSSRKTKVIFPSSAAVYGKNYQLPVKENLPCNSVNPYGMSKYLGEQLCKSYSDSFGVPTVALRFFNVYGDGQTGGVHPRIIQGAKDGKIVFKYGVSSKRDFVYIKDVVSSIIKAIELESDSFNVFNIGTGKSHSIKELTEKTLEAMKVNPEVVYSNEEQRGTVDDSYADISKAKKVLGWEPRYNINEGLRDMLQ